MNHKSRNLALMYYFETIKSKKLQLSLMTLASFYILALQTKKCSGSQMFVIQRNPFKLSATSKSSLLGSRAFCQQLLCPCCLLLARDLLSDGAFQAEHLRLALGTWHLRLALATIPAHAEELPDGAFQFQHLELTPGELHTC